ncbi:MAG: FtsX-like permease family protein [Caldimonas sp.]
MSLVSLALRNLLRNRRRSIATLLAVGIGSAAILLFGGYSSNIKYTLQTVYVRGGGHLQVQNREFFLYGSGDPTSYGIADYELLLNTIRNDGVLRGMLYAMTPMLQFGGIAGNYAAGVSRTVIGKGLVAGEYARMQQWNGADILLPAPPFALEGSAPDAVVVGTGVARVLELCSALKVPNCRQRKSSPVSDGAPMPDDIAQLSSQEASSEPSERPAIRETRGHRIELLASSAKGTPNVASVDVVRAETQSFKEMDEVTLVAHLAQAQQLVYGKSPPKVTALMLQLRDSDDTRVAQARIESLLRNIKGGESLAVLNYETLNPYYVQTLELFDTIFGFILVLIGGIVLVNVGSTMNAAVVERTVEIGTLRAIGMRRAGIRRLFVLEGLFLGVAGAFVGAIGALVAAFIVNRAGLTWLPPGVVDPVPLALRVWGEPHILIGTSVGLIVIATLSACWPAHRAAQMVVVDALRHV